MACLGARGPLDPALHTRMHTITHACLNRGRLQAEPIFTYEFQYEEGEAEIA